MFNTEKEMQNWNILQFKWLIKKKMFTSSQQQTQIITIFEKKKKKHRLAEFLIIITYNNINKCFIPLISKQFAKKKNFLYK